MNQAIQDIVAHYNNEHRTIENPQLWSYYDNAIMNIYQLAIRIKCMSPDVILETAPAGWIVGAYIALRAQYQYDTEFGNSVLTDVEQYFQKRFGANIQTSWETVQNVTPKKWAQIKKQLGWNW